MLNTRLLAWLVAALGITATAEAQTALWTQNTAARSNSAQTGPVTTTNNEASQLADDFTVPAGAQWTITSFVFDMDANTSRTLDLAIVNDASNAPGTSVQCSVSALDQAFTSTAITGGRRRTYSPTWTCTLSGGASGTKYWLTMQGVSNSDNWHTSGTVTGTAARARPYGGGWPTTGTGNSTCRSQTYLAVPRCIKTADNNNTVDFKFVINGTSCTLNTYYADADGDTYGDSNSTTQACSTPTGYAAVGGDCDNNNSAINPGATEVCNGADDNCAGGTDEGVTTTFYADADSDNYGDSNSTTQACSVPTGYAAVGGDCDDNASTTYPDANETCNLVDDDCDLDTDEGVTTTFYADADDDNFGDSNDTTQACSEPNGYASVGGDCDDNASTTYPGAIETCNLVDDNCDLTADEGVTTTFYADPDNDDFGDSNSTVQACSEPTGYASVGGDCDSTRGTVYPDANESCNELDDDCDLDVDEGVKTTFYADGDNDGYGDSNSTTEACSVPDGYATVGGDCDNNVSTTYPDANETCNDVDDDCDFDVDEGVKTTFYADTDTDGYGDLNATTEACSAPTGYVTLSTDCDDNASTVNPGEIDITCDQVDNDCSGTNDDGDSDGDQTADCSEECDDDPEKTTPDVCGCGLADTETSEPACGGGDADEDGLLNGDECADPQDCQDTDGDGTPDYLDTDSDGDGTSDKTECPDAVCDDADDDGLTDQLERGDADSDGDGTKDDEDEDSDNDDADDGDECVDGVCLDEDDDGIRDHLDDSLGDGDLDGDTVPDSVECASQPCGDFDDDGIPDYGDTDSDDDKVLDATDSDRIDPCKPNANALACLSGDFDNDGVPNSTDVDPSDACKPNPDVVACATGDADDDGTPNGSDGAPNNACEPNPNALACPGGDTDGDTTPNSTDPAPSDPCLPNANAVACASGDNDNDGTPNGTDSAPKDACIPTIMVVACATGDNDNDGTVNGSDSEPLNPCVPTANALACGTGDTDGDGTNNGDDTQPQDPCVPNDFVLVCPAGDTDRDGVPNGEDPQPENSCSPDKDALSCPSGDADDDGVPNGTDPSPNNDCEPNECEPEPSDDAGVTPGPVDSDGDGRTDDQECGGKKCPDTDGDGTPDNEDEDDDNDGIPTGVEVGIGDSLGLDDDIDGDDIPNWLDPDADGDGIPDGDEIADRDGDGVPDEYDSDKVKLSGGTCSVSAGATGTDLASWPLLSLLGLLFWRRRRTG